MNKRKRKSPRIRVAVIYGGKGSERDVSLSSCRYLLDVIDKGRYIVYPIEILPSGDWIYRKGKKEIPVHPAMQNGRSGFIEDGGAFVPVKVVFPLLHGDYGEDGRIQGLLDTLGFKYVGCGVSAGALCFDKIYSKLLAESLGIPTLGWISDTEGEPPEEVKKRAESKIGYPMFIKPARQGSSIGACPVLCPDDFIPALLTARSSGHGRVLIEEYAEEKRELEVAYLSAFSKEIYTHPGEVSLRGFYGYEEKYGSESRVRLFPKASIDEATADRIKMLARAIIKHADVRSISRIDFFLSGDKIYFNEINTMPGFTEGSLYPMMIDASGVSPTRLVSLLIEDARRDRHT